MPFTKLKRYYEGERKRVNIIALLALVVVGILVGGSLLAVLDVSYYGYPDLWEETNDVQMSAGDVLNVQDGDTLVAWLRDELSDQHKPTDLDWDVTLRLASTDEWVEDGGDASKIGEFYPSVVGDSMRWWFDLQSCLEGTHEYRVYWFAMIGDTEVDVDGYSFVFAVVNTKEPVYEDAVFVTEPDTELSYTVGQSAAHVTWVVGYDGPFTVSVTVDGEEDWSGTYIASSADDWVIYTIDTSVAGTQSVVLTVTPDGVDRPLLVSDTVMVTIASTTLYDNAVITDALDDVSFGANESLAYVSWTFDYDGPCAVDVTWDGIEVDNKTYVASDVDQTFDYLVDTSVAGTFTMVFTVTPDDADNPAVTDTAMVTVEAETPTDTTTTTTTPTEAWPPPDEPELNIMLIGMCVGIAAGAILIGILLVKGGRPKTKQKNKGGN